MAIQNSPEKRFVSEKTLGEMLERPVSSLQQDRFFGRGLPYVKLGKLVRYELNEVIAYLENCRVDPAAHHNPKKGA
ncbi:MAG: DNA-binding protein [Desulfovibrio sp.]|jgi:hypothetical protein|nr:DNA-binding protein [Desulfovibrio sp.]